MSMGVFSIDTFSICYPIFIDLIQVSNVSMLLMWSLRIYYGLLDVSYRRVLLTVGFDFLICFVFFRGIASIGLLV